MADRLTPVTQGLTQGTADVVQPAALAKMTRKKFKYITDPIHGHMSFGAELLAVIDTREVQRLRELSQLGPAHYVFVGACHNRFTHSLGVCHMAQNLMQGLKDRQPELKLTDRDVFLVSLAGLCHDLGHGPFSHSFETVVQRAMQMEGKEEQWSHEDGTEMLMDTALQRAKVQITEEERELLRALIRGVPKNDDRRYPGGKELYYFQIVANKQTGMDVDKYDYLQRDCYHVGCQVTFDPARLMKPAVRKDSSGDLVLSYYRKEVWMVAQLFQARFNMHDQVYGHSVVAAITLMLQDVMLLAKDWFRVTDAIKDPALYVSLTDGSINAIERLDVNDPPRNFSKENLRKAQHIIDRVKGRELYKHIFMRDLQFGGTKSETEIKEALLYHMPDMPPDHFRVMVGKRDFTRGEQNPLEHVPFHDYRDADINDPEGYAGYIPAEELQLTISPSHFIERYVRLYITDGRNEKLAKDLAIAVQKMNEHEQGIHPSPAPKDHKEEDETLSQQGGLLQGSSKLQIQPSPVRRNSAGLVSPEKGTVLEERLLEESRSVVSDDAANCNDGEADDVDLFQKGEKKRKRENDDDGAAKHGRSDRPV